MSRLFQVIIRLRGRLDGLSLALLTGLVALLSAQPAPACSVCAGDPNSALSQGAQAGMLVLLGVVGAVLVGLASLIIFWMRRAANLRALERAGPAALSLRPTTIERLGLQPRSLGSTPAAFRSSRALAPLAA